MIHRSHPTTQPRPTPAQHWTESTSQAAWWKRIVLLFALCVGLAAPRAEATTVLKLTDAQIVEMSNLFVRGIVVHQRSIWAPNKIGIVTLVTIEVKEEIFQRKAPKHVVVRHFGGQIGEVKMHMPSGVGFVNGEEVLVALEASRFLPANEFLLIGLTQGKWVIKPADPKAATNTLPNNSSRLIQRASTKSDVHLQDPHHHFHQGKSGESKVSAPKNLSQLLTQLRSHWTLLQKSRKTKLPIIRTQMPKQNVKLPQVKVPFTPAKKATPPIPAPKKN